MVVKERCISSVGDDVAEEDREELEGDDIVGVESSLPPTATAHAGTNAAGAGLFLCVSLLGGNELNLDPATESAASGGPRFIGVPDGVRFTPELSDTLRSK